MCILGNPDEEKRIREAAKKAGLAISSSRRESRYMDKWKRSDIGAKAPGSQRTISQSDPEENPRSIVAWKAGKYWVILDQATNTMTQGKSYQDAIFMLSDALKELGKGRE